MNKSLMQLLWPYRASGLPSDPSQTIAGMPPARKPRSSRAVSHATLLRRWAQQELINATAAEIRVSLNLLPDPRLAPSLPPLFQPAI